jgi:hypothetical protein
MYVDAGVQRVELALVRFQVGGGKVADEDRAGAIAGELVGRCAADAEGGVGA